jgi:glycosyltransferase involved in cell wall biosynthesis
MESAGLTIAEGAAQGLPALILSSGTGSEEMLINGETGIIATDWSDFFSAIGHLAMDPARRIEMGRAGAKFADRSFNPVKVAKQYLALYA